MASKVLIATSDIERLPVRWRRRSRRRARCLPSPSTHPKPWSSSMSSDSTWSRSISASPEAKARASYGPSSSGSPVKYWASRMATRRTPGWPPSDCGRRSRRALRRRRSWQWRTRCSAVECRSAPTRCSRWPPLELDTGRRMASWNGQPLPLTSSSSVPETVLVQAEGNVVTSERLSRLVFGDAGTGVEERMLAHVRRIRKKIEETPSSPRYLLTVRGEGFRLDDPKDLVASPAA